MKPQQVTLLYRSFVLLDLNDYRVVKPSHTELPEDVYLMARLQTSDADVMSDL
jgi:hypothetical protein